VPASAARASQPQTVHTSAPAAITPASTMSGGPAALDRVFPMSHLPVSPHEAGEAGPPRGRSGWVSHGPYQSQRHEAGLDHQLTSCRWASYIGTLGCRTARTWQLARAGAQKTLARQPRGPGRVVAWLPWINTFAQVPENAP